MKKNKTDSYVTPGKTIILCGTSRLPANLAPEHIFTIEVETELMSWRILNFGCTRRLPLGEKILQKSLLGYEVEDGIKNAIEQIDTRYFSNTRKAVAAALRDLSVRCVEYKKMSMRLPA